MTTTTQSLMDKFINANKPDTPYREKYQFERDLTDLLNTEAQGGLPDDRLNLLKEYRDNFEWDTQYQVRAEFSVDSTLYGDINCSKEEFSSYLNDTSDFDFEEILAKQDRYYMDNVDSDVYGLNDLEANIQISNLRLIPKDYQKFEEAVNKVIAEITSLDADTKAKILMEIREKLVQENKVKESEPKTD